MLWYPVVVIHRETPEHYPDGVVSPDANIEVIETEVESAIDLDDVIMISDLGDGRTAFIFRGGQNIEGKVGFVKALAFLNKHGNT